MDLFTLAAPIFDLAMRISGHDKVLVELGNRIKKAELKRCSEGSGDNLNLEQLESKSSERQYSRNRTAGSRWRNR